MLNIICVEWNPLNAVDVVLYVYLMCLCNVRSDKRFMITSCICNNICAAAAAGCSCAAVELIILSVLFFISFYSIVISGASQIIQAIVIDIDISFRAYTEKVVVKWACIYISSLIVGALCSQRYIVNISLIPLQITNAEYQYHHANCTNHLSE